MFAWFFTLIGFMTFKVVDEGGAGGADENQGASDENSGADDKGGESDVGNIDLGGNDADESKSPLSDDEAAQARELIRQNNETQMLNAVESSIKERTPEFNMNKTIAGLKELNKTDPKKAAYYNASEAGLEMYHKDHLTNVAVGDDINSGSHAGSDGDFGSTMEKARGGHKKSVRSALANSKA